MKKKHAASILICPLAWGTGHAARVQAIAHILRQRGHSVILAAPASLLRASDYDIYNKIIPLPSASVRYSSHLPLPLALLLQLPLFMLTFLSDRYRLPGILRRHGIDLLISDNRFGLWTKKVPCIYITHQLRVMMPPALRFASAPASALHRAIASRYDECWVPDMPDQENLSGRLSHKCRKPARTRYIGILSRFVISQPTAGKEPPPNTPYTLALLSGPEPQRSILEKIIMAQRHSLPGQLVIVAGKADGDDKKGKRDGDSNSGSDDSRVVLRIPWADSRQLKSLVKQASFIICRSGYSTVMDLVTAGRIALLVPTPGQPEQEYLACYLADRHGFSMVTQKELAAGIIPVDKGKGKKPKETEWLAAGNRLLSEALDDITKKICRQS